MRHIAWAASLMIHAVVIALLVHLTAHRRSRSPSPREVVMTFHPESDPPQAEPHRRSSTLTERRERRSMSAERKRPTPMAREQAPIQWDEEARRAAAAVIAREEAAAGLRSFGFPKRAEPHADPAPPSVFEEPWRQGRTEKTPDGETRVWVSENCYVPLESDSILLADLHQARAGTRICTVSIGKRKARGDLFDHLKPKYLKPESPGCAAGCEDANAE